MRRARILALAWLALAWLALACGACTSRTRLPSDAELRARVLEHVAVLDSLAAAVEADTAFVGGCESIGRFMGYVHDTPQHHRLLSDAELRRSGRWRYGVWLREAHLHCVSRADGNATFVVAVEGIRAKGIVHRRQPPSRLEPELDTLSGTHDGAMRVTGDWYVFLGGNE